MKALYTWRHVCSCFLCGGESHSNVVPCDTCERTGAAKAWEAQAREERRQEELAEIEDAKAPREWELDDLDRYGREFSNDERF